MKELPVLSAEADMPIEDYIAGNVRIEFFTYKGKKPLLYGTNGVIYPSEMVALSQVACVDGNLTDTKKDLLREHDKHLYQGVIDTAKNRGIKHTAFVSYNSTVGGIEPKELLTGYAYSKENKPSIQLCPVPSTFHPSSDVTLNQLEKAVAEAGLRIHPRTDTSFISQKNQPDINRRKLIAAAVLTAAGIGSGMIVENTTEKVVLQKVYPFKQSIDHELTQIRDGIGKVIEWVNQERTTFIPGSSIEFGATEQKPEYPPDIEVGEHAPMWKLTQKGLINIEGYYTTHTAFGLNEITGEWQYVTEKAQELYLPEMYPDAPHIEINGRIHIHSNIPTIFKIPLREYTDIANILLIDQDKKKVSKKSVFRLTDGTVAVEVLPGDNVRYVDIAAGLIDVKDPVVKATKKIQFSLDPDAKQQADQAITEAKAIAKDEELFLPIAIEEQVRNHHRYSLYPPQAQEDALKNARTASDYVRVALQWQTHFCELATDEEVILTSYYTSEVIAPAFGHINTNSASGGYLDHYLTQKSLHAFPITGEGEIREPTSSNIDPADTKTINFLNNPQVTEQEWEKHLATITHETDPHIGSSQSRGERTPVATAESNQIPLPYIAIPGGTVVAGGLAHKFLQRRSRLIQERQQQKRIALVKEAENTEKLPVIVTLLQWVAWADGNGEIPNVGTSHHFPMPNYTEQFNELPLREIQQLVKNQRNIRKKVEEYAKKHQVHELVTRVLTE